MNTQASALLKKYGRRIKLAEITESVNRGLLDQDSVAQAIKSNKLESIKVPVSFSPEKKIMLAQCLENTDSLLKYTEATNPAALGAYKRYALDMVIATCNYSMAIKYWKMLTRIKGTTIKGCGCNGK